MCVCVRSLPGHVDSHILVSGSGQDTEQLVEDGGQKVDHHMALHRMETLGGSTQTQACQTLFAGETTRLDLTRYEEKGCVAFSPGH